MGNRQFLPNKNPIKLYLDTFDYFDGAGKNHIRIKNDSIDSGDVKYSFQHHWPQNVTCSRSFWMCYFNKEHAA